MLSVLPWLFDISLRLPSLSRNFAGRPEMDKETYLRTVTHLQSRIQRLEENLENSRLENAQKTAMLKELRQMCIEKDEQLRKDIEEMDAIRKEFEELKRLYAERCRRKACIVM